MSLWVSAQTPRTSWFLVLAALLVSIQRICADERARAHAAPTGFNAIDVGGGAVKDFLKIPGGYRDGFQKVIFEEVGPTNVAVSPDLPLNDRFGAYDDTNVVSDNNEIPLFIPLPYRNETAEEKADRERKEQAEKQAKRGKLRPILPPAPRQPPLAPQPTRTIISNAAFNGQQVTIRPTVPPSPPRPQFPTQPQIQQPQRPFVVPQVPVPTQPRPVAPPQSPPNSFQPPFNPQQPQTRPPFVPPPQTRPANTFVQPQRPAGFTPQPPRQPAFNGFQSTFRPSPQQTQSTFTPVRTTQPPVNRPFVPSQQTQLPPRVPATTTLSPFVQQQQNQFRQLRPFRPNQNFVPQQPSSSFAPSTFAPQTTRVPSNLRTGVCQRTIYYKPQEATAFELQQPFSHFAVVVSVDQCARTCHEFNCAQAIFDPTNRHCQFNPGTKFSNPQTCEQWPNPLYRNNLPITARPITIKCVTCQVRRRTPLRPFQRQNKALGISQVQFGPIGRSTLAHRIHGVIINDNIAQTNNEDRMLNKVLEAEQIVNYKPASSVKTTNSEHLEPIKSSSAASNEKSIGANEDTLQDKQRHESGENENEKFTQTESEKPFQRTGGIIVHKLHPIESISLN